jgi:hypothetical protein
MPELRRREYATRAELQSIADQTTDRTAYLRLAETLTAFLTRLRTSAETLDIIERQREVRLLVKEILVSDDRIVIRHSIPLPTGPSGSHDPSPIGRYSSPAQGKVTFCVQGVATPPCGVPTSGRVTSPSSITPAFSHLRISGHRLGARQSGSTTRG